MRKSFAGLILLVIVFISMPVFAHELIDFTLFDSSLSIRLVAELTCTNVPGGGHTVLADGAVLLVKPVNPNNEQGDRVISALHDDGTVTPIVSFPFVIDKDEYINPWNCCNIDSVPIRGELVLIVSRPPRYDLGCPESSVQVFKISGLPSLRFPGLPSR